MLEEKYSRSTFCDYSKKGLGGKGEENSLKWTPTTFSYITAPGFLSGFHH